MVAGFLDRNDFLSARTAGLGGQGDSDGVADTFLQQYSQGSGRCHNTFATHASLGQTEMEWIAATAA